MAHTVIYRPNRPLGPNGELLGVDAASKIAMYYLVMQEEAIVAAYHLVYFQSIHEVIADLIDLLRAGRIEGPRGEDYAVWYDGRLLAALHQPLGAVPRRIVLFEDPGPTPDYLRWPGWPSYEQWVAEGKGEIVYDPERYPNPSPGR
jgi:hypothetical protein